MHLGMRRKGPDRFLNSPRNSTETTMKASRRDLLHMATAAVLTGGLVPAYAQEKQPIVLGCVMPVSSSWGQDVMKGVDLAVKTANAAGGVHQRPIKVITYDDQSKPEEGVAAVD